MPPSRGVHVHVCRASICTVHQPPSVTAPQLSVHLYSRKPDSVSPIPSWPLTRPQVFEEILTLDVVPLLS